MGVSNFSLSQAAASHFPILTDYLPMIYLASSVRPEPTSP